MNTIERLEEWKYKHKARSVSIDIDDGYGANCWHVELWHEHGKTQSAECAFFHYDKEYARSHGWKFASEPDDDEVFVGLDKVINTALDAFEEGIWFKNPPKEEDNEPIKESNK